MTGASASMIGWAVAMSTAGLDKGAPRVKVLQIRTPRHRCKPPQRVSSSSEDSSDNEDAETGHWKSKNKYREDEDEDMSRPWRRQKVDAFTRRISDFSEDKKRRMPANVKTYDGTGRSVPRTLSERHVKQRQGSPQNLRKRYKDECIHGKACPEVSKIQVPSFKEKAASRGQQKATPNRRAEKRPITPLQRPQKEILATEGSNFPKPLPMRTLEEQRVGNGYCEYHRQKGHTTNECVQLRQLIDKLVKEGRLDHLVKNIKEGKDKQRSGGKKMHLETRLTPSIWCSHGSEKLGKKYSSQTFRMEVCISFPTNCTTQGGATLPSDKCSVNDIHRMYIDGGASADILYEHCFQRLRPEVKRALHNRPGRIFMVIRSPSPYNGIIGRPGISAIRAVPSTAHGMLKFPVDGGIVTIYNTAAPPKEITHSHVT
ncbi:hypothetical protein Tco_0010354 [Tanacetum coccineum]